MVPPFWIYLIWTVPLWKNAMLHLSASTWRRIEGKRRRVHGYHLYWMRKEMSKETVLSMSDCMSQKCSSSFVLMIWAPTFRIFGPHLYRAEKRSAKARQPDNRTDFDLALFTVGLGTIEFSCSSNLVAVGCSALSLLIIRWIIAAISAIK